MPLGKALHERFFGPLGLDATWYQASEKPRARTAHGYRFAGTSRTAPAIDLSDGTGIVPFTSVVTAAAGAGSIATTSEDAATWARLLYSGQVLGPEMTAEMLRGVAPHGRLQAARPVRPRRPGVPDRRPADDRPQRDAARVPGRDALPAGRGDDDLRPDQPEPGRPRRDRPGPALGRVRARAALLPLPGRERQLIGRRGRRRPVESRCGEAQPTHDPGTIVSGPGGTDGPLRTPLPGACSTDARGTRGCRSGSRPTPPGESRQASSRGADRSAKPSTTPATCSWNAPTGCRWTGPASSPRVSSA